MKATLIKNLFSRPQPTNTVEAHGFLDKGSVIDVVETVQGDPIDRIATWYKATDGFFYWGGGVEGLATSVEKVVGVPTLSWWVNTLKLTSIWENFNEKGDNANVAILDSGYNTSISDLTEAVIESKVFFKSVAGNPVTINDTFGHGSHCASLIAGRNKNFITGCAPSAGLYVAKICSQGSVRSFSIMVDAIKWAIEKKVDVISISYGGESSDAELEAIIKSAVNDHNIAVVASIGDIIANSLNAACFPALYKECIAVGATNSSQQVAAITILDNKIEINAPGENIPGYGLTDQLINKTGTSQAAAIVAGVCALIISKYKKSGKVYTVGSIRDLLTQNSEEVMGSTNQKIISPLKIFSNI